MAATLAHVLVERGFLDYDTPVTDVWPEFGGHGKAATTVQHVLTHTVGLPAMPRAITPREPPDWSRVCESLAATTPLGLDGQLHFATPNESQPGLARLEKPGRQWPTGPDDGQRVIPDSLPVELTDERAREVPAGALDDGARPHGIVVDARGSVWFTELGLDRVGVLDMGGRLDHFSLPGERPEPHRITVAPDRRVQTACEAGRLLAISRQPV